MLSIWASLKFCRLVEVNSSVFKQSRKGQFLKTLWGKKKRENTVTSIFFPFPTTASLFSKENALIGVIAE